VMCQSNVGEFVIRRAVVVDYELSADGSTTTVAPSYR